jgi:hypothetical protein
MANAGMPHVLAMFKDDEQRPIWNGFDFLEGEMSS